MTYVMLCYVMLCYVMLCYVMLQVEVTKFEELEETHAELKLKQTLWDSFVEWDVIHQEWMDVRIFANHFLFFYFILLIC